MRKGRIFGLCLILAAFAIASWLGVLVVAPLLGASSTFVGLASPGLHTTAYPTRSAKVSLRARPSTDSKEHRRPVAGYSHVHIYADSLRGIEEYKELEAKLNSFAQNGGFPEALNWQPTSERAWTPAGQDLVEQMLVGLGWRVTGHVEDDHTRSLAVTSSDSDGVKFVVSAPKGTTLDKIQTQSSLPIAEKPAGDFFDASNLERFAQHQNGRQGVAVLGFEVKFGGVEEILRRYEALHPTLILPGMPKQYPNAKVLEVYAYYQGQGHTSKPDFGTVLRFVESSASESFWVLPGMKRVEAQFPYDSLPAYADHWVSNVCNRTGFLSVLGGVLEFTPKVDFNAGVVAAGEAQIESTVAGNDPGVQLKNHVAALRDQSQIYLPINNALSKVGHVYLFLRDIGQGVQHIASRVADLPALVQRANDYRKATGAGFDFLHIPDSYYGLLTPRTLSKDTGRDLSTCESYILALKIAGMVSSSDTLDLSVTRDQVRKALPDITTTVLEAIMRSRYSNMYALLRDRFDEETYMKIVRNRILVDVQGGDLLLQIFTANILQRQTGEESPFLEFIQRVCVDNKKHAGENQSINPGCGGFGIRNFLTLFLSIELSKAAESKNAAVAAGRLDLANYHGNVLDALTSQLHESNPVLTLISDAMVAEKEAMDRGDEDEAELQRLAKADGQATLQKINSNYKDIMKVLRQAGPATT